MMPTKHVNYCLKTLRSRSQMMDIEDVAIQVGGAKEGQPFVLKV
jgi:hypothetical protein